MQKLELTTKFINRNLSHFQCPLCKTALISVSQGLIRCKNNHSFNIAKKGNLFFLNHPVQTEYTDEMLRYRHQFLTAGFFDKMLSKITNYLEGGLILDAGSGEGTTTKWLAKHHEGDFVGLDISKPAINIASSGIVNDNHPLFMVGDLAKLPFANQSLDTIVNILSPANYQEFDRTLKKDGKLIKVIPGNHYLSELRQLVYPEGEHATYDNSPVKKHFIEHYPNAKFTKLNYRFDLNQDLFTALFNMTPLTWQAHDRRETLLKTGLPSITAEFEIGVVEK